MGLGLRDGDGAGAVGDVGPGAVPLHALGELPGGEGLGEEGEEAGQTALVVVEQRPYAAGGVGEGVLVGREDLGGGEPADPLQGVEVVAEGIGDRRVVGVLVQADVRGDLRQQVVAAEQPPVAGQPRRVLLLQVEADMARRVSRGPDRA